MVCSVFMPMPTFGNYLKQSSSEVVEWVRGIANAEPTVLADEELVAALKKNPTALVGFFSDLSSDAARAFQRATTCVSQVKVFVTTDVASAARHKVSAPAAVLFKPWGSKRDVFRASFDAPGALAAFIDNNAFEVRRGMLLAVVVVVCEWHPWRSFMQRTPCTRMYLTATRGIISVCMSVPGRRRGASAGRFQLRPRRESIWIHDGGVLRAGVCCCCRGLPRLGVV